MTPICNSLDASSKLMSEPVSLAVPLASIVEAVAPCLVPIVVIIVGLKLAEVICVAAAKRYKLLK